MKTRVTLFCLFMIVLLMGCAEDESIVIERDSDFFPLAVGNYHLYQVNETQYTPLDPPVDLIYDLMLSVVDSFENTSGGITYVINRSRKDEGQNSFSYLDTWSARVELSQIVVNEGNIPFVRLAFPLVKGKQWNGNALNILGGEQSCGANPTFSCDIYKIENEEVPFELNGEILTETIDVLQNNNTDLIVKKDVRKEIYARNIGLVYKESTILEFCTVGDCIGQQQIERGMILKQTLIEYGGNE